MFQGSQSEPGVSPGLPTFSGGATSVDAETQRFGGRESGLLRQHHEEGTIEVNIYGVSPRPLQ